MGLGEASCLPFATGSILRRMDEHGCSVGKRRQRYSVPTFHTSLDGDLDGLLEDLTLSPDFDDSLEFLLHFVGCTSIGYRSSLGDDL